MRTGRRGRVEPKKPKGGRALGKRQDAGPESTSSKFAGAGRKATGGLGARAVKILDFIVNSIIEKGLPPTIREIGNEFKISSTNGVRYYLGVLEKAGCIKRKGKISRGIEVKREWIDSAMPQRIPVSLRPPTPLGPRSTLESIRPLEFPRLVSPRLVEIPLVGRVAAGTPVFADENIEDVLTVDGSIVKPGRLFALRVRGDSMKNAGILDGDIVIVRQQSRADSGDIVVALIGEEATVKRYILHEGKVILEPENENYEPIVVTEEHQFSLVGRVIGALRKY